MKVGINVVCAVCGHSKRPRGRSAPLEFYMCEPVFQGIPGGCEGYELDPQVGDLWPGETEKEFGYHVGEYGTKEVDGDES